MKISICMNTARGDKPMQAYPDTHMFEYFMSSLREQTFKDFEVVISDVIYNTRPDYFKTNRESFPVKHVPCKPNIWTPRGYCAISTTKNTCLLYAEGEIVVFTDDCCKLPPQYLEKILEKIAPKIGVSNMYKVFMGEQVIANKVDPRPEGYVSGTYGNVALYMDDFLDLNGYNECFDGTRGLEDCDFSRRAFNSGIQWWLMAVHAEFQYHNQNYPIQPKSGPRCCRLAEVLSYTKRLGVTKANWVPYNQEELEFLQQCNRPLNKGGVCPFTNLNCEGWFAWPNTVNDAKDFHLYSHPSLVFNLREQRKDIDKTLNELAEICKGD